MRVSFAFSYDKAIQNINSKKAGMDRLTTMLTSGKRLLTPQDDPFSWSRALNMKQGLRELDAIGANLDFAANWNTATEAALGNLSELFIRAQEVAIRSSKPLSSEEMEANSEEVEQIFQEALQSVNSTYDGLYIFSGWFANDDIGEEGKMIFRAAEPPLDSDLNYQGNTGSLEVRTGRSSVEAVNMDGEQVFVIPDPELENPDGINIIKGLRELKDAIQSGSYESIQKSLQIIEAAQLHLTSKRATVGTRLARLDRQQQTLADLTIVQQSRYAALTEADYIEVISQFQQKQTAFEAALRVTSMLSDQNLLKYL
jgi:flagellar hook-associated protein 3 FlgL